MHIINKNWIASTLALGVLVCPWTAAQAQSAASDPPSAPRDSARRVYNVNRWVSGGICVAGAVAGILSIPSRAKPNYTQAELDAMNPDNVPSYDRWSLHQNPALIPTYENYSLILQVGMAAAPLGLLFDGPIRKDWVDVMLMRLVVN